MTTTEVNITEQLLRKVAEVRGKIYPSDDYSATDLELALAFVKACAESHKSYEYPDTVRHVMWALEESTKDERNV